MHVLFIVFGAALLLLSVATLLRSREHAHALDIPSSFIMIAAGAVLWLQRDPFWFMCLATVVGLLVAIPVVKRLPAATPYPLT